MGLRACLSHLLIQLIDVTISSPSASSLGSVHDTRLIILIIVSLISGENSALQAKVEESPSGHRLQPGHSGQKQSKTGRQNTREKHAKMGFLLLLQWVGGGLKTSAMCPWVEDTGQKLSSDLNSFTRG